MALNVHARLTADGSQAQSEIRKTAQASEAMSGSLEGVAADSRAAGAALDGMSAKSRTAFDRLRTSASSSFGAVKTRADQAVGSLRNFFAAARDTEGATASATAGVGSLTAQFNDIGVMLAAGQNPLQLAIQQGTQIGQVFQASGVKGRDAFRFLLQGATAMLSPINLITIGTIALGGALVKWLGSGADQADGLAEALEGARSRLDDLDLENRVLSLGLGSEEELALVQNLREAQKRLARAQDVFAQNRGPAAGSLFRDLEQARGEVALAKRKLQQLRETERLNERLKQIKAAQNLDDENISQAIRDQADAAGALVGARMAERAAAEEMLASLRQANELEALRRVFGEESVEVKRAMADAERAAFEATLDNFNATADTLGVTEDLKEQIQQALEVAIAMANTPISGPIHTAANEASRLANNLGIALSTAIQLANSTPQMRDEDAVMSQPVLQDASGRDRQRRAVENFNRLIAPPRASSRGRSGGGGGGGRSAAASAADREREAVEKLIERQERELDLLRETDPVQKEMIRLRETLKSATAAQRAEIEANIATLQSEEAQMKQIEAGRDQLQSSLTDLVTAGVRGGDALASAFQRLKESIIDAAAEALLVRPIMESLSRIGGAAGGGGLFGFVGRLFGGAFADGAAFSQGRVVPFASGGVVTAPTLFPMAGGFAGLMGEAGPEAIVPLARTRDGKLGVRSEGSGGHVQVGIQIVNETGLQIRREQTEGPDGSRQERLILSEAVGDAMQVRGGAAQRQLARFGLRQRGPRR